MAAAVAADPAGFTALIQPAAPGRRVLAARPLDGGLHRRSWRLSLDGGAADLVLRFHAAGSDATEKERAVAALVGGRVPVPALLHLDATGAVGGRPYALLEWREGLCLDRALAGCAPRAQEAIGRACGAVVAAIGAHRFPQGGLLDGRLAVTPWPETIAELVDRCLLRGPAAARLGAAACRAIARRAAEQGAALRSLAADSRLVHGDLRAANLLITEEGGAWRVAAVLDWELCHAGTPLLDLALLLRGEPGESFASGLGAGFRGAGGELPPGWRRLAQLLDLVSLGDALDRAGEPAVTDYAAQELSRAFLVLCQ